MDIFTLVGSMTLDGADKVNQQLDKTEAQAQKVQKGMKIMGAAMTAVGVAGLAIISSTKEINAQLAVTGINLGLTKKEMRDLALETTNVTFPISEVTETFDLLARAGVKDQEVLKNTATAFDTLGDAIGQPASQVTAKLIPTMKTFNLSADEMAGKTDSLTYLFRNTTVSLDDFNRMVGYVTPDLVDMGLTTEDMIAILADLEDQGYSGEVMTREFRKAVTNATKEQIPLNEALGVSTEKMEDYKKELEGAEGITQEYADVANEQYTIMDKIKQKWSELTLKASGFLEPLEPILAGMTAMGPMMIFLGSSAGTAAVKWGLHTIALIAHKVALIASTIWIKAVTVAQWLWNIAMSANPIGLIILAIAALIAIIILVVKNWDWVKEKALALWNKLKEVFGKIANFFKDVWDKIVGVFKGAVDKVVGAVKDIWNKVTGVFKDIWNKALNWGKDLVKGFWEGIKGLASWIWDKVTGFFKNIWGGIKSFFGFGSPSRLAIEAGGDIAAGLAKGIEKGVKGALGDIRASMEDIEAEVTLRRPVTAALTPAVVSPIGGETITNTFYISQLVVREEADIDKIARELYHLQESKRKARGG